MEVLRINKSIFLLLSPQVRVFIDGYAVTRLVYGVNKPTIVNSNRIRSILITHLMNNRISTFGAKRAVAFLC